MKQPKKIIEDLGVCDRHPEQKLILSTHGPMCPKCRDENTRKEINRYDGTNGNGYQPLDDGSFDIKNPPKEE